MAVTRLSFSYPIDMKKELETMAKNDNRSLSSFVQLLLKEGMDKRKLQENKRPVGHASRSEA